MDFMKKVEDVMSVVAKKATEVKEISKIKYSVYDLKNDVRKLYLEIGKQAYQELKDNPAMSEGLQMKFQIVEAKLARIRTLEEKESKVRNMGEEIPCPVCGRICEIQEDFCSGCGASLVEEVETEVSVKDVSEEEV